MNDSLVSMIVPAYNAERFLGETLEGAVAQTYTPVEVIVVDDGSTDATSEVAARFGVRVLRQSNGGRSAARNAGIAAARGAFLAFCDADDVSMPTRIESQMTYLAEHPELGVAGCMLEIFMDPGVPRPRWVRPQDLEPHHALQTSTLLVRRELFETIGSFDTSYDSGEEHQWLSRAIDAGVKIGSVDEVLVRYRVHHANASHDRDAVRDGMFRFLRESVARKRHAEGAARS